MFSFVLASSAQRLLTHINSTLRCLCATLFCCPIPTPPPPSILPFSLPSASYTGVYAGREVKSDTEEDGEEEGEEGGRGREAEKDTLQRQGLINARSWPMMALRAHLAVYARVAHCMHPRD